MSDKTYAHVCMHVRTHMHINFATHPPRSSTTFTYMFVGVSSKIYVHVCVCVRTCASILARAVSAIMYAHLVCACKNI